MKKIQGKRRYIDILAIVTAIIVVIMLIFGLFGGNLGRFINKVSGKLSGDGAQSADFQPAATKADINKTICIGESNPYALGRRF